MDTFFHVFRKEAVDNFRDRRSLLTAVAMVAMFPLLMASLMGFQINRSFDTDGEAVYLPVIGSEHAPNLRRYLESNDIVITGGPADADAAVAAVEAGDLDMVLRIPENFGEQLADMIPAKVELYLDQANTAGIADVDRVRNALSGYNQTLAGIRLAARGVNPMLVRPLNIDTIDVSTPSGRAAILLGMMSYILLFSLLMGGMYLAIDATAGERERGSLEPLLSLPVARAHLVLGKIAGCGAFMAFSLLLSLLAWFVALNFMPLEQLGMTPNFNLPVVFAAFLLLCPMLLIGASLLTLVASFTRTYKEAQTWLTFVILAPTMPIMIVSFLNLRPRLEFMFVPSLSQHLILVDMISNEPVSALNIAVSVLSTLAVGAIFTWVCVRLYHRETLLG